MVPSEVAIFLSRGKIVVFFQMRHLMPSLGSSAQKMIFLLYGPNFLLFPKEEKEKSCNNLRCLFDYARKDHRDPLHTYPLEGIRASVARGLRVLRFEWFEREVLLAKDTTLCLRILKGMLRKSEQS